MSHLSERHAKVRERRLLLDAARHRHVLADVTDRADPHRHRFEFGAPPRVPTKRKRAKGGDGSGTGQGEAKRGADVNVDEAHKRCLQRLRQHQKQAQRLQQRRSTHLGTAGQRVIAGGAPGHGESSHWPARSSSAPEVAGDASRRGGAQDGVNGVETGDGGEGGVPVGFDSRAEDAEAEARRRARAAADRIRRKRDEERQAQEAELAVMLRNQPTSIDKTRLTLLMESAQDENLALIGGGARARREARARSSLTDREERRVMRLLAGD